MLKSLFNKVPGLMVCNFFKKKIPGQVFSCNFSKIFKKSYFVEHGGIDAWVKWTKKIVFTKSIHKKTPVTASFLAQVQTCEQFFFVGQSYWLRDISETSEWKSTTKSFSASTWFIHFDGINCIYFRNTELTISLKINAVSLIRNTLAIILTNLLKQDLTFSSNTF